MTQLQQEILNIGMSDFVEIVGPVEYKKLPELYKNSEIAIFGSICENCPNILLESMATGIPILCSDAQPMPEFAEDSLRLLSLDMAELGLALNEPQPALCCLL